MPNNHSGHQLPIPPGVKQDPSAQDVIRVWIANKGMHSTLRISQWEDPAICGLLLADLARHIAKTYEQEMGLDPEATLKRIQQAANEKMRE